MGRNKVVEIYYKIQTFLTPVKLFSIMLILLGIVDNLTRPTNHTPVPCTDIYELVVRSVFIFSGLFGFLGNGRTTQIRATLVSIPYLFLSSLYVINYIETGVQVELLPFIIVLLSGVWLLLFGAKYENDKSRNTSFNHRYINCSNT